jgi:hypothetical protein
MNGSTGLAVAAGAFALLVALPQPAAASRGASTRSDGGVSSRGTAGGSSSHSSSGGSGGSSGSYSGSSSSSHSSGSSSSGSSTSGSWGGRSSHATGTSKPTRDEGGASSGSNDTGRTAVHRPGAGEVAGRQPSHGGRSHSGNHRGGYYYGGRYYDPWYYYGSPYGYGYGGWGWGWGWGRGSWWPWGPGGVIYDGPYHRGGRGSGYGALDIDIWPGETEIYVDGERVGTADDFDGFPTYLWLPRGTYDVVFYLDGFRTLSRQYSIYDGLVVDVNDRLERGEAIRPEDLPSKSTVNRDDRLRRDSERSESARRREDWRRRQDESDLPPASNVPAPSVDDDGGGNAARLRLDVSPDDASIYLDGNFLGTAGELEGLSAGLVVAPGSHRLEVVRPGYEAENVDFEGTPGQEVSLKVSLDEE